MNTTQQIEVPWLDSPVIRKLHEAFHAERVPLRLVGGCVRDTLLELPIGDIDAATPATPEQVIELLTAADIKAIPTGLAHGTVTALIDHTHIEITTLRKDAACDGRHAEVSYTDSWEEDARRRDFTMNALYLDLDGTLYDYTDGINDLKASRVRFIGDPDQRIQEDYLRILRFFRFVASHGHHTSDDNALKACARHKDDIANLSGERIYREMHKLLAAPDPYYAIEKMQTTGVWDMVAPGGVHLDALKHLQDIHPNAPWLVRLAALIDPGQLSFITERWLFTVKEQKALAAYLDPPPGIAIKMTEKMCKQLTRKHGGENVAAWLWLALTAQREMPDESIHPLLEIAFTWQAPAMPVTGRDLLAHGIAQGEELGHILQELETYWEEQDYQPARDELLARLK